MKENEYYFGDYIFVVGQDTYEIGIYVSELSTKFHQVKMMSGHGKNFDFIFSKKNILPYNNENSAKLSSKFGFDLNFYIDKEKYILKNINKLKENITNCYTGRYLLGLYRFLNILQDIVNHELYEYAQAMLDSFSSVYKEDKEDINIYKLADVKEKMLNTYGDLKDEVILRMIQNDKDIIFNEVLIPESINKIIYK